MNYPKQVTLTVITTVGPAPNLVKSGLRCSSPHLIRLYIKVMAQLHTQTTPLFSRYLLSHELSKYTSCTAVDHTSVYTRRARTVGESSSSQLTRLSCYSGTRRSNTNSVSVGGRRPGVRERDQLVRAALAFQKRARTQKFEGTL